MAVVNSNGIFKNPLSTSTFILPPTTTLPQIEEALTMFTSNEYEEESGPILYNAAIILDNRPNFVHSKFLFSKLSLLFIFPPKHLSIMDCPGFRRNCTEFKRKCPRLK